MKRTCTGEYFITATPGEKVKAFIPFPLPPKPPIHISDKLLALLEQASLTIGKLDSLSINMPDSSIILYQYIRKEAVLSSQIEGTQSSLSDLLKFENDSLVLIDKGDFFADIRIHSILPLDDNFLICAKQCYVRV